MHRLLALAFLLAACAGPQPAAPALTDVGTVLTYQVTGGSAAYPFVVVVTQNDNDGTGFAYDLGEGRSVGTVRMTAAAREAASGGMLNNFGSQDYSLTDRTSVWMARSDMRRLRAGDSVTIRDGAGGYTYELDQCGMPYAVPGADRVMACRFVSPADAEAVAAYQELCDDGDADSCTELETLTRDGAATIVALDDADEPLILDMKTAEFRVTLQRVERGG